MILSSNVSVLIKSSRTHFIQTNKHQRRTPKQALTVRPRRLASFPGLCLTPLLVLCTVHVPVYYTGMSFQQPSRRTSHTSLNQKRESVLLLLHCSFNICALLRTWYCVIQKKIKMLTEFQILLSAKPFVLLRINLTRCQTEVLKR